MEIKIQNLIDDEHCYAAVRDLRWPEKTLCPHCRSDNVIKRGKDDTELHKQRYECKQCDKRFDDLTNIVFSGHHQPLKVWILFLYFMGLNLSTEQISKELNLNKDDAHYMASILRTGVIDKKPTIQLAKEVECDEVYVIAGHKGNSSAIKKGRIARRNRLRGARGRGTLEKEKPPIFGMIQRSGEMVIQMFENVKQTTIKPLIESVICAGTMIYTDEYNIYSKLSEWGYKHKTVNHGSGEYARDEDGDGFHEVHINTMEGFWSLLRSWLRPHRGISQEKLPIYLDFFEFVHNIRKRGKALLGSLVKLLVT
jgi:transposase-like protein